MSNTIHKLGYKLVGNTNYILNKISFPNKKKQNIVVFDTSINTDNLGDYIIMHYCNDVLNSLFKRRRLDYLSTHTVPSNAQEKTLKYAKYKFVCGTNLLTSHIEEWWNWRLPDGFRSKWKYRKVVLLGVGWGEYQNQCSDYSELIYKTLLDPCIVHSVRDKYTEDKLRSIGITNVINTGCPTMWKLTPEFCMTIPSKKAKDVVTTVTDYRRDIANDSIMFDILHKNYRNIYVWIQGKRDEEYLKTLNLPDNVIFVPRSLKDYKEILSQEDVDYVGTRLHAGIFALNHHIRSIIIAVDNRAIEIAKDTNLPIVLREQVQEILEERIVSDFSTEINLNQKNIDLFQAQFKNL